MVTSIIYVFQGTDAVNRADLSTVVSSLTSPKRPHDHVALSEMKEDFQKCLDNKVSSCNSNFKVLFITIAVYVHGINIRSFHMVQKFGTGKD